MERHSTFEHPLDGQHHDMDPLDKLNQLRIKSQLSIEQEVYLKKLIIFSAIDHEVTDFGKHASLEYLNEQTTLMKFVFSKCILEFPPFKKQIEKEAKQTSKAQSPSGQPTLIQQLEYMFIQYPSMKALSSKATKSEDRLSSFVNFFDLAITTPQEKIQQDQYMQATLNTQHTPEQLIATVLSNMQQAEAESMPQSNQNNYTSNAALDSAIRNVVGNNASGEMMPQEAENLMAGARRQTLAILTMLFQDIATKGTTSVLFESIKKSNTIAELPPSLQQIFHVIRTGAVPFIAVEFSNPERVAKVKSLYHLTPRRTLKAILMITNPLKMMTSMMGVFLARPLGARNLLQRMFEVITEIGRTQKNLKSAKNGINLTVPQISHLGPLYIYSSSSQQMALTEINKVIIDRIDAFINTSYDPSVYMASSDMQEANLTSKDAPVVSLQEMKDLISEVFSDTQVQGLPMIDTKVLEVMNEQQIKNVYESIKLSMRLKDKMEFIELLGDTNIIGLIQKVIPTVYQPLVQMYSYANLPQLLSAFFSCTKGCIEAAENTKITPEERVRRYTVEVEKLSELLFQSVKKIIMADKGDLGDILLWATQLLDFGGSKILLDLESMLNASAQRENILKEVDEWLEFKKRIKKQQAEFKKDKQPAPTTPHIAKYLRQPFIDQVSPILNQKIASKQK